MVSTCVCLPNSEKIVSTILALIKTIFLSITFLSCCLPGRSQVTIGSGLIPEKGVLLQLKSFESTGTNANADRGLLLPRVKLASKSQIVGAISGVGIGDENLYQGLIVYNLTKLHEKDRLCPGIHVWDGKEWIPTIPYPSLELPKNKIAGPRPDLVDIRGTEVNPYSTAHFYSYKIDPTACEQHNKVRTIDAGVWMTQNLRTEYSPNNTHLTLFEKGFDATMKAYHYPQIPPSNLKLLLLENPNEWDPKMGLVYSQNAVLDGSTGSSELVQGICPLGWHIPSNAEWDVLAEAIMAQPELHTTFSNGTVLDSNTLGAGMRLAEQINGQLVEGMSKAASDGGFAASLVGRALVGEHPSTKEPNSAITDNFMAANGGRAYFWSSTLADENRSWILYVGYKKSEGDSWNSLTFKTNEQLLSVRCKKNDYIISGYILGNNRKVDFSIIDPNKITHLNYSFLAPSATGGVLFPSSEDKINLKNITKLKAENKNLKLIVSVGGNKNSANFKDGVSTDAKRMKFAQAIGEILNDYELDGVDIDWEFPDITIADGQKDIKNYTALFETLRKELDKIGTQRDKKYIITAAVATYQTFIDRIEFDMIQKYVDYFNVMLYDIPSNNGKPARHHANLYNTTIDGYAEVDKRSVNKSIQGYLAKGVAASKLVLGVPFYGKFYHLKAGSTKGIGDEVVSFYGVRGYVNMRDGLIGKSNFVRKWDAEAQVPYLLDTTTNPADPRFVTYEDEESILEKSKYIKSNRLGGIMFWEYSYDLPDNPLLNILNDELK